MAGWEEELAMLLRELEVTQEEPKTYLQPTRKGARSDVKWGEQAVDDVFLDEDSTGHRDVWLDDLILMRLEVETIVSQVMRLIQRGNLDTPSKQDVMMVLHTLRQHALVMQQTSSSNETMNLRYLEAATAMLHFCRLVLRFSESTIEDL